MRTTSRKRSFAWLPFGAAAFVILVAVLFRHSLGAAVEYAAAPLLNIRNAWSNTEVAQLQAELASTSAMLADRNLLAAENAVLRAELGRAQGRPEILAGVLERPPGTPYDTLLVDVGSKEGVELGERVSFGAVELGEVDTVYDHTARVTLYSAPGQSYQALLITASTSIPLAVAGQGAGSLSAQVPQGVMVKVGDHAVLPGALGGIVADVAGVTEPPGGSFENVYLRLPTNIFELRYVYIHK